MLHRVEFLTVIISTWAMAVSGAVAALAAIRLASERERYTYERAWTRDEIDAYFTAQRGKV